MKADKDRLTEKHIKLVHIDAKLRDRLERFCDQEKLTMWEGVDKIFRFKVLHKHEWYPSK